MNRPLGCLCSDLMSHQAVGQYYDCNIQHETLNMRSTLYVFVRLPLFLMEFQAQDPRPPVLAVDLHVDPSATYLSSINSRNYVPEQVGIAVMVVNIAVAHR
jgi:hypothetical protein